MPKDVNQLEREFKVLTETVGKQIEEKMKLAAQLLTEATKLADEHGIPFYAPVSVLGQTYVPESFEQKYERLDYDDVADMTGVPTTDLQRAYGWQHSDVC